MIANKCKTGYERVNGTCRKSNKLWGIFSKEWKIWFHYVLLTVIVIVARIIINWLSNAQDQIGFAQIFLWLITYFLVISISDQIIHKILGVD